MKNLSLFSLLSGLLLLSACVGDGTDGPAPVTNSVIEDIAANYNTIIENMELVTDINDYPGQEGKYTFYDLDQGITIADSSSDVWDIAFSGTTLLANSAHGGGIQVIQKSYSEVENAPESGFEATNASWYIYTGEAPNLPKHAVLPNSNATVIIKTPTGKYSKMEIISYYEGNPDVTTAEFANYMTRPADGYFSFNYVLQESESTQLYHVDSYTFLDLDTGSIVEDSLSSQWDIGFNATNIIANTGHNGGIQPLNTAYNLVDEAPLEGYGSMNAAWYTYTMNNTPPHAILPKENYTLTVKTPDNLYAKFRVISYYKGNPDVNSQNFINFIRPADRHYTIEYALQKDGSRFFE
jgi:hypothetical protein